MSVKEISNYSRKTVMTIENQLVSKLFKLGNLNFLKRNSLLNKF